ncbi:general vesicular transport factor p115 [Culicoides brevitarsis]|uniref:general vesicular transport factor p115 n=1 Tax=Culicoides brevitarsis TaxID=469753 RepID=UPI00307BD2C4
MNFLKSVLGSSENENEPSGADTVERLVDRVESSTQLEDRRDAVRALKALSRKYRVEVGAQGMNSLIEVLQNDRADSEILGLTLDTLGNIISPDQFEEELDNPTVTCNIGEQFTEMFIKRSENVSLVLNYLEEFDFRVRWSALKLLSGLVENKVKEIQEVVLVSPMAVSKLMDLLSDSREVIRNDALLLMIRLTKGNANIQKIVAFENAFDRLFDIISQEGASDGGIVVKDCLFLMLNLLRNNSSNQQFFKEGSYIQRLAPMFLLPPEIEETGMTAEKVENLHCMLQVVRTLVSPSNSLQIISACQKTMRVCGLLEALCNILMGSGIPPDILTETLNTVGECIRSEPDSQSYFETVMAPSTPPRPAIIVLLMSMVNDKQPLSLRCAVLYCFECYLYRNDAGQNGLIQTLLPSDVQTVPSLTAGQLLCGGLFSSDSVSNWFSAVGLMHGLLENQTQKEQLLRVLLATSPDSAPVSLLTQCTTLLQQPTCKPQSKIGLLMLLSVWLSNTQVVVKSFLNSQGSIAFLIAQICANEHDENEYLIQGLCAFLMGICIQFNDNTEANHKKEDLCQLLLKRIGLETYNAKLGEVSKHESYSKAAKHPQLRVKTSTDLFLDYEFCKLFKSLEAIIIKTVHGMGSGATSITELTLSQEATGIVSQYKDVIRDQDLKIQRLTQDFEHLTKEHEELTKKFEDISTLNAQLSDQNTLLKAQLTATNNGNSTLKESETFSLPPVNPESVANDSLLLEEIEKLKKDQEDLLELLADQDSKLAKYKMKLKELGHSMSEDDEDNLN